MKTLPSLVAVVTGAGAGIGAACAWDLARGGASVVVSDLDGSAATAVSEAINAELGTATSIAVHADVTSPDSARQLVATALEQFGRLDIAINNAGVGTSRASVADMELDEWERTLAVNLHGVLYCMQAEIPALRASGGGSIVNIGSIMSTVAFAGTAAYVASKHAVVGLTKVAALDHASDGIRVNAVGPGFVRTNQVEQAMTLEEKAQLGEMHPRGQMAEPSEIASLVTFLASPAAANMTGGFYVNDGGYTTR